VSAADLVLVTGASGFLGRRVVAGLLGRGMRVRALVRNAESAASLVGAPAVFQPRLELVFGILGDANPSADWLRECGAVVHAAGGLRGSTPALVQQNVVATRSLVRAAVAAGVSRFVLVSSLAVYHAQRLAPGDVLDETCPLEPAPERRSAYVYSKVAQEEACWQAGSAGLPLVVLRPGVIFGPGRSALTDRVGVRLGKWLLAMDLSRRLPYTFVDNCAAAVVQASAVPSIDGEAFNVVDDELPTVRDVIRACRQAGQVLRAVPVPRRCVHPLALAYQFCHARSEGLLPPALLPYVVDALYRPVTFSNARARARLAWRPAVNLATALARTIERRDPAVEA
jgi:nucleoside-diphosphate-sugar epimerase